MPSDPLPVPYASLPPIAAPPPPSPVAETDRLLALDVLRGVAILGILLVNIAYYALPARDVNRMRWWELPPADGALSLFVDFFCSFKFITLFSILFGMGLALQNESARRKGRPFLGLYSRRLFILLLFGITHGTLLWYGDILTLYALLGFVALFCRNWSTKILMRVATVLFLIPLFGLGGCLWLDPYANMAPNDSWMELGEWIEADMQSDDSADGAALNQSVSSQSAADDTSDVPPPRTITTRDEKLAAFIDDLKAFFRFLDDEKRIYQSGSYIEMCLHRTVYFVFFNVKSAILVAGWRSLAMFLLGVVLIRRGLMMAPNRHAGFFRRLAVYGIALGASVEAAGYYVYLQYPDVFLGFYVYLICLYAGSLGLSLGYLALLTLACTRNRGRSILRPFAAVGRMALTNYLGHSILCNLIFYGYGLALFGRLPFWAIFLIALGIFVAQLCLSPLWLRHFHFGPFEWLWRSLTYPRRQPFRRAGTRH